MMLNQIPEIQVAVKFIASCLYGKLPRRRADLFAEELSSAIQTKFQVRYIYFVLRTQQICSIHSEMTFMELTLKLIFMK